jgi:precorrin-6B methylase 2
MDRQVYRDQSREAWGSMATSWAARSERTEAAMSPVNDWLVRQVDPQPGQVVLDVAAGPGGLGHRVAPLVGSTRGVISVRNHDRHRHIVRLIPQRQHQRIMLGRRSAIVSTSYPIAARHRFRRATESEGCCD